jgi:phosphoribosylformylglycinamidine synthase I
VKFSVVVFPGSNSDYDAFYAASRVVGEHAELVWHKDSELTGADAVILPGGFAHGDYLRTGAIARFSPIMSAVKAFAERGGPVLGICNGFQVLLEAGLLPGAMVRNDRIKFVSRHVPVRVEQTDTPFTAACESRQILNLPIAHGEGNYYAPPDVLDEIEKHRQVIFRYTNSRGEVGPDWNPNGSLNSIAGICNRQRNVVGLMPHPERASEPALGSADGRVVLASAVKFLQNLKTSTPQNLARA